MENNKLPPCPFCGQALEICGPEDWKPTFYDPDSGGDPYIATCACGLSFCSGTYDYQEFAAALNRRFEPANEMLEAAISAQETLQTALAEANREKRDAINELCHKCGRYREEHNGACDGCRWHHAKA